MGFGEELRQARLSKKLTCSQVAAGTHMKVQIVEDLEREDFHRIAAPIYAKGFIRLYAEHVGLDSKPLIDDYMDRYVSPHRPAPPTEDISIPLAETKPSRPPPSPAVAAVPTPPAQPKAVPTPTAPSKAAPPTAPEPEPDLFRHAELRQREKASLPPPPAPPPRREPTLAVHREPVRPVPPRPPLKPALDLTRIRAFADRMLEKVSQGCGRCFREVGRVRIRLAEKGRNAVRTAGPKIQDGFQAWRDRMPPLRFNTTPAKTISLAVGTLIILIFVISGLSRCSRNPAQEDLRQAGNAEGQLRVAYEPEEPYLD